MTRVERLAQLASELGGGLDAELVERRLCSGARELFGADGAFVAEADAEGLTVRMSAGAAPARGTTLPATLLPERAGDVDSVDSRAAGLDTDGAAAVVTCTGGTHPLVLCLLLGDRTFSREDADVLRLLVSQGAAALANAATHAVVVAQREHEQAVVDVLADGVLVLDSRGLVLSCNDVAAALLGSNRKAPRRRS